MVPNFIHKDIKQTTFIAVSFEDQILPGSFEHTIHVLVEKYLDLTIFHPRYKNSEGGRPAYDPAVLLKVVLLAYSKGITSSRRIEELCRNHVTFMALSADSRPHFTTLADFISSSPKEIAQLFVEVLLVCDQMKLIGKEMFAIDGCKLPSNASKEWSGTKAQLKKKQTKIERAVGIMLNKHREEDETGSATDEIRQREKKQIDKLNQVAAKIKGFLANNEERKGQSGKEVQSNITDNESAKMKTSRGVIQGYNAVAAADAKHQVVTHAEVFGQGPENDLLKPMLAGVQKNLNREGQPDVLDNAKVLTDSGFHSTEILEHLEEEQIDGYIADTRFRSRDPRFQDAGAHKPETTKAPKAKRRFSVEDFEVNIDQQRCICPAGKAMRLKCAEAKIAPNIFMQFQGNKEDCDACPERAKCLRSVKQQAGRQVNIKIGSIAKAKNGPLERMKQKIDSELGRHIYSRRLGIVEPVFGQITACKGLDAFSLRGKVKVNAQWQLFTMIHNMTKIHRYGFGFG